MKRSLLIALLAALLFSVSAQAAMTVSASDVLKNAQNVTMNNQYQNPLYRMLKEIENRLEGTEPVEAIEILESTGATYYTKIQGGNQSANLTLTLPTAYAATTGYVLSSTDAGVLSWIANGGTFAGGNITSDITLNADGIDILADTTTAHTYSIGARDIDGAAYVDILRWTNGNTASMVLGAATVEFSLASTGLDISAGGAISNATTIGMGGALTGATDITASGTVSGGVGSFTTLYQPAIAAASAGNVALTINAAGNGTITVGGISTGATIFAGNVDLGNGATDTVSFGGYIDSDVTLDDGTTDSPTLTLKDATDETLTIAKADGGDVLVTLAAARDFEIVTGNLAVGNGSPGTAAMDGQDFYVTGASEFDGAVQMDGALTLAGDLTSTDQFSFTFGDNAEEGLVTTSATDYAADSAIVTLTNGAGAGQTNATYVLRLRTTANADAQDHFLVVEDKAGDDKLAVNSGGVTIHTLDAAAYLQVDGDTTANTTTAGILDLNLKSATANNVGIHMDYELDDGGSGTQYGLYIDLDDDGAGGDETFNAIYLANSAGTNATAKGIVFANTLDNDITATLSAAATYAVIDAATADNTSAAGVMDVAYDTITNGAYFLNIDMGAPDPAGTVSIGGILIDLDDDTNTQAANISGVAVTSSDLTGNASSVVRAFYTTGCDVALQADYGYVRVGTGSTPGVTPGDDDLYVEGTAEVDTYVRTPYVVLDSNSVVPSEIHVDTVELLNSEIKGMRAAPVALVAAPGANKFIEVISAVLILDYGTNVLTESVDNMVIQYNTSGTDITGAIEATGFIDQAADTICTVFPAAIPTTAAANMVNRAVELFNTGDGEYAGNAGNDTRMTVKITYTIHSDGL